MQLRINMAMASAVRAIMDWAFKAGFQARRDRRGNVAMMFGLTSIVVTTAVGSGIDLTRTYLASQQLAATAQLTCQYATNLLSGATASVASGNTFVASVSNYLTATLASQKLQWTQTNATPFVLTGGGAGEVTLDVSVPTTVMRLVGVTTLPVQATEQCVGILTTPPQTPQTPGTTVVKEGFENAPTPTGFNFILPTGHVDAPGSGPIPLTTTPATTAGYTGLSGVQWIITGYCLEIDDVGVILGTVPEGTHSAELDCDNGSNSAGNSSISTKTYLAAGTYELRWGYAARVPNTYYGTSYICGTTATDTAWANDGSYVGAFAGHTRTNQINVYLDQDTNGSIPTHTTLDGAETLAGANMIDECVYSDGWIQRSVKITVTTPAYYWLSFAADGANDSFGGQIDNIMLCVSACAGTVGDDFPTSWLPASNGGGDVTLFEDTFESPSYSGTPVNLTGNVGLDYGASNYWGEQGHGWGDAPTNQIPYWTEGCPQGNQCVQVGSNGSSLISKPFLLDPGYYQVSYDYVSAIKFAGLAGTYCGATPGAAGVSTLTGRAGIGINRVTGATVGTQAYDTAMVGVFLSNAGLVSTPNPSSTPGSTVSYTNPDGSVTSAPTVPTSAISLINYNTAQPNQLLDICGYAATPQTRKAVVYIEKPALYWLTFAALGTSDAYGGIIDDVRITALGSPNMASVPTNAVTIPVPDPQPDTAIAFNGFSIGVDSPGE
jgi:Flp pilus assembly protein TadG